MKGILRFKTVLVAHWVSACTSGMMTLTCLIGGMILIGNNKNSLVAWSLLLMSLGCVFIFKHDVWLLSIWMKCRIRNVKKGDIVLFADGNTSEVISLHNGNISDKPNIINGEKTMLCFSVLPWVRGAEYPTYYIKDNMFGKHAGQDVYGKRPRAVCIIPNRWGYRHLYEQRNKQKDV